MRESYNGINNRYKGDILPNVTDIDTVVRWMLQDVNGISYLHEKTVNGLIQDAKQRFPNCPVSEDELYNKFSEIWNRIYGGKKDEPL